METQHKVIVGLCTCGRPIMLASCLVSLKQQQIPSDLEIQLVVVDNEERPNNRQAVLDFAKSCSFPVHYVHQPLRGIAAARNAALENAVELGADWIAFLDDDETAAPDWIAMLMVPEYRNVPVVVGHQRLIYPDPLPFWARAAPLKKVYEGKQIRSAATCNVRFSTELIRAGLRFNESFGFSNGSDTEFFLRARQSGFEIRQTLRAITYEVVHPERLTYLAQVYRSYCHEISLTRRLILKKGRQEALVSAAIIVPRYLLFGAIQVSVSPLCVIAGAKQFAWCAVSGGEKLGRAVGTVAGLFGVLPQPYRSVVGR